MDTVLIEDECQNVTTASTVIDLDDECDDDVVEVVDIEGNENRKSLNIALKQLEVFEQFLQQCLSQDCSPAMLRVINRTLIPLYKMNGSRFQSDADTKSFDNALTRALHNVTTDPVHRFSHIKELCEILKYLKNKTKVPVVKNKKKRKGKKRPKLTKTKHGKIPRIDGNVINIDDDEFEVQILNLDAVNCGVEAEGNENCQTSSSGNQGNVNYIEIEVPQADSNIEHASNETGNTPNYVETVSSSTDYLQVITEVQSLGMSQNMQNINFQANEGLQLTRSSPMEATDHFSSGHTVDTVPNNNTPLYNIRSNNEDLTPGEIEKQIEIFKKIVDDYSVQEVYDDSAYSPYIQCEYFQKKIVMLYDKLCLLKGCPSVKRREVRLRAIDSRPELPIKKLENLINSNIGHDGLPHFPDFEEVTNCVREANIEGNLGWDCKQIITEARGLFVHCGKALQTKRQRREWRDLMSLVKDESLQDPADSDPILAARLHMNKLIAKSKEYDILEKYTSLEQSIQGTTNRMTDGNGIDLTADIVVTGNNHTTNNGTTNCITNGIDLTDDIDVTGDNQTTNNDDNVAQIRIGSISSGEQVVSNESSNNPSANCNASSTQTDNGERMESQNYVNLTNSATQNNETPLVDNVNKNAPDNANENTNEQTVDMPEFNSKSSSNIQVVSIETFDDFDTNNNEGVITNTENSSKDGSSKKNSENVNPIHITQIYFVNMNNITNQPVNIEKVNLKRPVGIENINLDSCTFGNTAAPITSVKKPPNVLQVKRKTADGTIVISEERRETINQSEECRETINQSKECRETINQSKECRETINQYEERRETNEDNILINHDLFSGGAVSLEVKSENTIRELNELGNDFTVKILNVIDPFLIVEISSDSSEDEDDQQDVGDNMNKSLQNGSCD